MTSVKHPITSDGCTSCRTTAESFLSKDRNLQAAAVPQKLFCYCCNQDLIFEFLYVDSVLQRQQLGCEVQRDDCDADPDEYESC